MDRYDNANTHNIEKPEEDEPFYYSPACGEDIICPGSDAEETAEETQQKHLRYEYQARRYMLGHLPVLQSATLRGPFSGWINPWRWVPREDDWWQPGSENMLFTRENVMKRAANHGFGYLSPAEALAWCKAEAQAEAQRINGDTSVERDIHHDAWGTLAGLGPSETPEWPPAQDEPSMLDSDPTTAYGKQSMTNHYSGTRTKRPIDSQWLKGSYVSKRARWDGPAISTPTPLPEIGEKPRRRHQSFPRRTGSRSRRTNGPSLLTVSFADIQLERSQVEISLLEPKAQSTASPSDGNPSVASARHSTNRGSSLWRDGDVILQREEIDELHGESQESSFASTSRRKAQRRSRDVADALSLDLEPDDLIVITPHQHSSPGMTYSEGQVQNGTSSSRSCRLPKLPRNIPVAKNSANARTINKEDDYSFITEIAPSSRDLETFQYGKKRRRKDSESSKANSSITSFVVNCQKSPQAPLESEQDNEDKHQVHNLSSIGAVTGNKMDMVSHIVEPIASGDGTRERSNHSNDSWELMDDVTQQSAFQLAQDRTAVKTVLPNQHSNDRNFAVTTSHSQASRVVSKISSQHSKLSFRSSQSQQSQSLPDPRKNSPRPSAVKMKINVPQDPNDMSTQSHNTSPLRLPGHYPSDIPAETHANDIQHEARSSEEALDVMKHIQQSLSQNCSDSNSAASTQGDGHQGFEVDDHNEEGVGSIREPPSAQRHVTHSSGRYSSSQTSVKGKEANMVLDGNTKPTVTDERANATQHNLHENFFQADNPGIEPRPEVITVACRIPASTAQDSSFEVVTGKDARTGTDSTGRMKKIPRGEISISGAPGNPCEAKDVRCEMGRVFVGHEHRSNKTRDLESETGWEGCGPQSPWAAENLELHAITLHEETIQDALLKNTASVTDDVDMVDDTPKNSSQYEQQDWYRLERPRTPQNDVIKPFADLMSPILARGITESNLESDGLPSTQLLLDAATNNPWISNLRNPSSKKSKNKRVSFGVLPSDEKENSQPDHFDNLDLLKRTTGSPAPQRDSDEEIFDDGTTRGHQFGRHFIAARQFKHILPQNQSSPLNSSPAFGAQAEAFIAADFEASAKPRRLTTSLKSPARLFKPGRDRMEENLWSKDTSPGSFQTSPKVPKPRLGNHMASFDMDDALEGVGDFLEDWSIDAELKKAKEAGPSRPESTGYRRRKLFGLV
jgi:hypothetical protein